MSIIIVESPNKVKKIRELTGFNTYATVGHFADLPGNEMGIDMQTYQPHFVVNAEKEDNVEKIISASDGQKVYIASDADREGYAIGRMLYDRISDTAAECWRLELKEITEKGIKEAMAAAVPWEETNHLFYDSFLGRRVADRLSGYILSPLASKELNGKFSVGRVQSPAVRLVVDREHEIRNFKPTPFFTISAKLSKDEKVFTAQFDDYKDETKSFKTKEEADLAISDAKNADTATVMSVEKKVVNRGSKAPFTTVDLQAAASIALSISPEKTMQLSQGLFENGLITYHRTDSVRLSDEFVAEADEFIKANFGDEYLPEKRKVHVSKNSQAEAHEGVRPTHLHSLSDIDSMISKANLTSEHGALYTLIFKRAISSIMSDATFDSTVYKFDINGSKFKTSGQVPVFKGWMALYIEETEDEKEVEQILPVLVDGEICKKIALTIESKTTKAPGRFTEASLVKMLEKLQIGRPSTYASIIGRIKTAGYVAIEKKKLVASDRGEMLIDLLQKEYSWIIDYKTTADMETYLDLVAVGEDGAKWQTMIKDLHSKMNFYVPVERENTAPSEKQITLAQSIAEKKGIPLPSAILTSGFELSKWLEKHITKAEEVGNCKCGGAVKEWDKSFQCGTCKKTVWKSFLEKKITKAQAINLMNDKTISLSGLKSKAGKEFDAKGKLKDGKIELIFGKK